MQRSTPILWGLLIILLILNLVLLYTLNQARLAAVETLSKVETALDSLANEVIIYNIEVNQAVPIKADVPFSQTLEVSLNTVIPIDQVLTVPFETPAGEVVLDVPVQTNFPIDIVVPVDFNETINVDTVAQLNTSLPVEIDIAQTPLAGYLKQAKLDIANLRSRLALQDRPTVEDEAVVAAASQSENGVNSAAALPGDSPSHIVPVEAAAATAPTSDVIPQLDTSDKSGVVFSSPTPFSDKASAQPDLGLCTHAYWPLRPGTIWTYNSPDTSYAQRVDGILNNHLYLSTQYEGRGIQFSMVCYQDGLGGYYLGDMRRLTELGELNFGSPRGMFLPHPEIMEDLGSTWTQEFDITGRVQASQRDSVVDGEIRRGRAVAVYTPTGIETVETPLGLRDALRIEQKLDIELDIDFDLGGQTIPAREDVRLTTVYWFVKGVGPVKIHWQGGAIQHDVTIDHTPVNQKSPIPALAEDRLVFVCVWTDGGSSECIELSGISQSNLTNPPDSELEIQGLVFPIGLGGEQDVVSPNATATSEPAREPTVVGGTPERPTESDNGDDRFALLAYAEAVEGAGTQLDDATQDFWKATLDFRRNQLTLDDFREEFSAFRTRARSLIQKIDQLSPPRDAETIHQRLGGGLVKCDQAIDLMDDWFDTQDSGTREAVVLLVTECVKEVQAAGEELVALTGE